MMSMDERKEYLSNLADEHGLDIETVLSLAESLGPSEDYDGLVRLLEDAEEMGLNGN